MTRSRIYLATVLVTACATAPDPDATGPTGAGGKADGASTTLRFSADWSERADGPLVAGSTIRVDYDLDRLTDCRGSTNGSEVWGVTGFASFDGGPAQAFAVSRLSDRRVVPVVAELEVPARAASVAMWFQNTNRWGCNAYDSNDSANYRFDLEQHARTAVLAFEADWTESQSASIHAGDRVILHYAPERLATCAGSTGGHAAWGVTASWQIDGGAIGSVMVSRGDGPELVAADPELAIPRGRDLAVWFEATNVWGCHAYDSDLGANYHARIE